MAETYNPEEIEKKWQEYWKKEKLFEVNEDSGRKKLTE